MTEKSLFYETDPNNADKQLVGTEDWRKLFEMLFNKDPAAQGYLKGYLNELTVTAAQPSGSLHGGIRIDSGGALVNGIPYYNDSAITLRSSLATAANTTDRVRISLRYDAATQLARLRIDVNQNSNTYPNYTQNSTFWDLPICRADIVGGVGGGSTAVVTVFDDREPTEYNTDYTFTILDSIDSPDAYSNTPGAVLVKSPTSDQFIWAAPIPRTFVELADAPNLILPGYYTRGNAIGTGLEFYDLANAVADEIARVVGQTASNLLNVLSAPVNAGWSVCSGFHSDVQGARLSTNARNPWWYVRRITDYMYWMSVGLDDPPFNPATTINDGTTICTIPVGINRPLTGPIRFAIWQPSHSDSAAVEYKYFDFHVDGRITNVGDWRGAQYGNAPPFFLQQILWGFPASSGLPIPGSV